MAVHLKDLLAVEDWRVVRTEGVMCPDVSVEQLEFCLDVPHEWKPSVLYFFPWKKSLYDPALESLVRRASRDGAAGVALVVSKSETEPGLRAPSHLVAVCQRLGTNLLICPVEELSRVWTSGLQRYASDEMDALKRLRDDMRAVAELASECASVNEFLEQVGNRMGLRLEWKVQPVSDAASHRVTVARNTAGYLVERGIAERVTDQVLRWIGHLAAAIHYADVARVQVKTHYQADLLQVLLDDRADVEVRLRVAHQARLDATAMTQAVVFLQRFDHSLESPLRLHDRLVEAEQRCRILGIPNLAGYYQGHPVVLVQHRTHRQAGADCTRAAGLRTLVEQWAAPDIIIGLSSERPLQEGGRLFQEALEAAVVGRALDRPDSVMQYAHISGDRLFYALLTSPFAMSLAQQLLQPIIESDRVHHTEFFRTLSAFFQCNRKLVETARALNLHRNSLRYRLDQIERLLGFRLDDSERTWLVHLAILTFRTHGFPLDPNPRRSG
ncbi:PucR family transcriptional regulator [Alicyclobacillus macrosporangiidus]|uniref:PucR family transcriptional regulator n=1 Tax=Alicyclobacillus macrosporangiidus TaxID=392015 RepID=UPI00049578A5|nr:helix-turn-helix domain-containing protein [Alicyclobacillus macrosporangiidus]